MMQSILNVARFGLVRKSLAAGTMLIGMAAMPSSALAGHHHGFHIDVDVPVEVAPAPCDTARIWIESVYQTVSERQWIAPVYQTTTERVWVQPTTTNQIQRVYVPDQYGWQDVVSYDTWGRRRIYREQVLISSAHYEDRQVGWVEVAGHFQDVQHQQLVCEGHWNVVQRQELVAPGHWDVCAAPPPPTARLEFRLPF